MTWFKVDDGLPDHRKVRRLGSARVPAVGLWTLCGAWSSGSLSDGFVPDEVVERYDSKHRYAHRLVDVGLWIRVDDEADPGYLFHDWTTLQPTRAEVERRRSDNANRVRRWRERKQQDDPGNASQEHNGNGVRNEARNALRTELVTPPPARPDPTRPVSTKEEEQNTPSPAPPVETDRFDEFYAAYPRKVQRRDAEKAWREAVNRKVDPDHMITAAKRYAAMNRNAETRFIKHPGPWLRAGAYDDNPDLLASNGDGPRRDPRTGLLHE